MFSQFKLYWIETKNKQTDEDLFLYIQTDIDLFLYKQTDID